jgi:hypothetical protein
MLTDMDRFCPYRELAPSRQRAAGPEGPYTSDLASTTGGFLSAMIFRAITFNTDFFRTARIRYRDHTDFAVVMTDSARLYSRSNNDTAPSSFFCNTTAYGPHNSGRTVGLADLYGPLMPTENIGSQLALARRGGETSIPFLTFWKWLKGSVKKPKRVRFSNLGPLGSYLLAADYTYTNPRLVAPPTLEDLGTAICMMNKGAVAGLEILGLIPKRLRNTNGDPLSSTPEACIRGLGIVHSVLCSHWTSDVQSEVWFDLIMIEHSLCKFSRAIRLRKFKL